jgi:hypothetical protein
MMKNPIPRSGLFVTPTSEQDLYDRIEQLTGSERALAWQFAMFTFNLCSKMVEDELRKDVNWNDYMRGPDQQEKTI